MTRILELLLLLVVFFGSDETVAAEKIRIAVSGGYNRFSSLPESLSIAVSSKTKDSTPISS